MGELRTNLFYFLKIFAASLLFFLFLIAIGMIFFKPPEFSYVVKGGFNQSFKEGESFIYNLTYFSNDSSLSYISAYKYFGQNCFEIFVNGNRSGFICKTNSSFYFPFLPAIPTNKEQRVEVNFYYKFNGVKHYVSNYTLWFVKWVNYSNGYNSLLRDSMNGTYIVDSKGIILYANTSNFVAKLINKN